MPLMDWPPYTPDLNVWGGFCGKFLKEVNNMRTLVASFINAIETAWNEISLDYLKTLYESISNRIFKVIKHHGGNIHY